MSTEIAIRAYTVPKLPQRPHFEAKIPLFDRTIILGLEATHDYYQNLRVGYFEIYQHKILEEKGLFYDPVLITAKELAKLQDSNIKLYTIEEFRKIFLYETWDLETLCVGFDLPFILTRIAMKSSVGRIRKKDGFSLLLSANLNYPRLHITHYSNTLSFIEYGNTKSDTKYFKGNFVNLKTLCNALTDTKHTLESACKSFKVDYHTQKSNKLESLIGSCIGDAKACFSLYQNAKAEFDQYQLPIPITRAYTPASIAKAILNKIGVKSFLEKNRSFPPDIIGYCMNSYFGARTECKIRKTPVLIDELDFLAMFPTVCVLQNLWKLVIAEKIEHFENTDDTIRLVEYVKLEDIQNPSFWGKTLSIVLVEPENDVLPVRSLFGQKYAWNIGVCEVTSKIALYYPLADVIYSKLATGKTPKILKSYSFVPVGIQSQLREIEILGMKIDPKNQDLFKELVEYRQKLKKIRDYFGLEHPQHSYYDRLQNIIKIITNAISYGIFVEITTHLESKPIPVDVYGITQFTQEKTHIEQAGHMFNPIIASVITSASRLLLGCAEIILQNRNCTHAYCDTDSMMIPPQYTKELQDFFQPLSPYSFDSPILKLEKSNKWFFGISTKRYCLYDDNDIITVDDEKYSAHGLGHLLDPFGNESEDWYKQIWQDILDLKYGKMSGEEFYQKYENKFAMQKLLVSTPEIWKRFDYLNEEKDYLHQIKPFNSALLGFSGSTDETDAQIKPFAPYIEPAKHAVYGKCVDYNTGKKICGKEYWKVFSDIILEYLKNPESKLDGNEGILKRKSIVVSRIIHIGKESNDLEKTQTFGLDSNTYVVYEDQSALERKFRELIPQILKLNPRDVKRYGISKQTLWNMKQNIKTMQIERISHMIKMRIIDAISFL